jgi:hypothetical protein
LDPVRGRAVAHRGSAPSRSSARTRLYSRARLQRRRSRSTRTSPGGSGRTRLAPLKARHRQYRPRNRHHPRRRPHRSVRRHRFSRRRPSGRHRQAKCLRPDCQTPRRLPAPRLCGRSIAIGRRRADRRRSPTLSGRFRLRCRRERRHRNYGKCSHRLSQRRRSDKCSPRLRSRPRHNDRCNRRRPCSDKCSHRLRSHRRHNDRCSHRHHRSRGKCSRHRWHMRHLQRRPARLHRLPRSHRRNQARSRRRKNSGTEFGDSAEMKRAALEAARWLLSCCLVSASARS